MLSLFRTLRTWHVFCLLSFFNSPTYAGKFAFEIYNSLLFLELKNQPVIQFLGHPSEQTQYRWIYRSLLSKMVHIYRLCLCHLQLLVDRVCNKLGLF